MEAPEKLYLLPNGLISYCRNTDEDVEYISTDAFIEKSCEWLKNNVEKYYYLDEAYDKVISIKNLNNDFKKYMQGLL